jgi:hypothetical protein
MSDADEIPKTVARLRRSMPHSANVVLVCEIVERVGSTGSVVLLSREVFGRTVISVTLPLPERYGFPDHGRIAFHASQARFYLHLPLPLGGPHSHK